MLIELSDNTLPQFKRYLISLMFLSEAMNDEKNIDMIMEVLRAIAYAEIQKPIDDAERLE